MAGSIDMEGRAIEFKVKAGSRMTVQLTVADSSGVAKSLANTVTYNTGKWKVWKPGGTIIINGDLVFTNRAGGIVSYALLEADTVIANAGRWEGEVELKDSNGDISEQTKSFTFTIEESY